MRLVRFMLVCVALLHLSGGHWGVMQAIAWARMLVDYSAQRGLLDGVRTTFDGRHPCAMCRAISTATQEQSQDEQKAPPVGGKDFSVKKLKSPESILLPPRRSIYCSNRGYPPVLLRAGRGADPPMATPPRGV